MSFLVNIQRKMSIPANIASYKPNTPEYDAMVEELKKSRGMQEEKSFVAPLVNVPSKPYFDVLR